MFSLPMQFFLTIQQILHLQEETYVQTYKERLEALEKGPFNIVFHGLKPDWIEEEMIDDDEFKKDVLEQRIKKIIKDEVCLNIYSNCLFDS